VPCGIPKLNTAALDVPELATVAEEPGARVVVVPAAIVAAAPGVPTFTQEAGAVQVNVADERELTIEMDAQTTFVGFTGGVVDQPAGAVPVLV
jgi:hypothetical protein